MELKQTMHTRFSAAGSVEPTDDAIKCLINDGILILLSEHSAQNMRPHTLQWCFLLNIVNGRLHEKHCDTLSSEVQVAGVLNGMSLGELIVYILYFNLLYMSINKRITLRVALCGECQVGKTSLMLRASGRPVPEKYIPTVGIDTGTYRCQANNFYVTIKMWDVSGDARFHCIARNFFRDSSFILFCFDLSRPETFHGVKYYVKKVSEASGGKSYTSCVVGIKKDETKESLNTTPFKEYAESISASYYEVDTNEESDVIFLMHSIAKDGVSGGIFQYDDPCESEDDETAPGGNICCYM